MPITDHPCFNRPLVSERLWRYTDLPKFLHLITTKSLWLTNAEILATEDPYEGAPGAIQFPHRVWKSLDEMPKSLRKALLKRHSRDADRSPSAIFRSWCMEQEQVCIMLLAGRRQFMVNCWHAGQHESAAMWKIYGAPGAGVAVVTNGARLSAALQGEERTLYLGGVNYVDPDYVSLGISNAFEPIMIKRSNYAYEQEVRLVHWDTTSHHDPLKNFNWDEDALRFTDLVDDPRDVTPGISLSCDIEALVEKVVVSPFAPPWYLTTLLELRDQLGFKFPVVPSPLNDKPYVAP